MYLEEFNEAKNLALKRAIDNFRNTKKGSYKILKLIKENIKELVDDGLNMREQVQIINTALDIKISYSTYKAFYYFYINNKTKYRLDNGVSIVKKEPTKNFETKREADIFADLKG